MPELNVSAPALQSRDGPPPALTVSDEPTRWCAVEVAVTPEKLAAMTGPSTLAGWASWEQGMLRPGSITIPDDAWVRLRAAERLYYRAHSSTASDAWVDHRVTVPDSWSAAAPSIRLCDCWSSGVEDALKRRIPEILASAARHPEFHAVNEGGRLAALVCLHRFSPKRPMDPSRLEWVVLLASQSPPPGEVLTLVERLAYTSLSVITARMHADPGSWTGTPALVPATLVVDAVEPEVARWPREERGPFLILRNNSPAPGEEGGTCVIASGTGRCVYYARTKWQGTPEVRVPL